MIASRRIMLVLAMVLLASGLTGCGETRNPSFQGWVEADMIFVSPDEQGRVVKLNVREGDKVEVGMPLYAVDDDLQQASLNQSNATLANAQQAYDRAASLSKTGSGTQASLDSALAALRVAGSMKGDRIEHAAVVPPELMEAIRALALTVVTQPHFIAERGDAYLRDVAAEDQPWLYRLRGFMDAGVPLAAGSDVPYGDASPWKAMQAAVSRRSERGVLMGREETLTPEQALALFLAPLDAPGDAPRRLRVGEPADLCLLATPWQEARKDLSAVRVQGTWRAGQRLWWADGD